MSQQPQTALYSLPSIRMEIRQMLDLIVPTAIVELSTTIPPALTAMYVGRQLGSHYLNGFTLATLTGNLLSLSLLFGLFTASDTLSPQAFGAGNYKQVGYLAMRGYIVGMVVVLPINAILWNWMHLFLIKMHQDVHSSQLACEWFRIYIWGIPFYALFCVLWKFLSAQSCMTPLVISSLVACGIVLPCALEWFVSWWGFQGSALAIVVYQSSQALILVSILWYKKPYKHATWPGLHHWKRALKWQHVVAYLKLGCGGILGMSEWWFWEVVALMIGSFGVVPLSVHTIPTQVITVSWMIPLSVGLALAVRLGATLPHNVQRAKQLCVWCHFSSLVVFGMVSVCMYTQRQTIFAWFTTEPEITKGCESIWKHVCWFYFFLSMYGINMGMAWGLGMQWTLGIVNTVFFWILGLPIMYYFSSTEGGGLEAAWTCMSPPYVGMNVVLLYAFWTADWNQIQADIRKREGMNDIVQADKQQYWTGEYGSIHVSSSNKDTQEEKKAEEGLVLLQHL